MKYVPFLKFKVNEIAALKALSSSQKESIIPFFDLPRNENTDERTLKETIEKLHRKYEINLTTLPAFYIDNYDIDDSINIDNDDHYLYLLKIFADAPIIPVVGIDRTARRNEVVFESEGLLLTDTVAFRITHDDLDYQLVAQEIDDILNLCFRDFSFVHLVIDNRVCNGVDIDERSLAIKSFIDEISKFFAFDKIIVTGSSIPGSIRELLEPGQSGTFSRYEVDLYRSVTNVYRNVILGDYTVISPNYSDVKVLGGVMRRVTAPKVIYSHDDSMYIMRGFAIDSHPRGNKQYNDLSANLISQKIYRTKDYSFGDQYLFDKANNLGKDATPSTIPKSLINSHIAYMLKSFVY